MDRRTKFISGVAVKKFLNSHGFRYGGDLVAGLEDALTAVLCASMRNSRVLDKHNNRRITVYKRDIPATDAIELATSRRERRLKRQVQRLEEKLKKFESLEKFPSF